MDYINAKFGDFGRAKGLEVFKVRKALILRSRDFNPVGNFTQMFNFTLYWQTKEMSRVIAKYESQFDFDPEILGHISPIQWDNILMYGSYVVDPDKIRISQ